MSKAEKRESKRKGKSKFQEDINKRDTAFVLFYATWCPFSQRFLPIFERFSKNNPKECLRVIVDEEPDVCEEYGIEYYPTVILFKRGRVQKRLDAEPGIGLDREQLEDLAAKHC